KLIDEPVFHAINRHAPATSRTGAANRYRAGRKVSKRKPTSRGLSRRTRCDTNINRIPKITGTAMTALLKPAAEADIHSAITTEETTDAISQMASARSDSTAA